MLTAIGIAYYARGYDLFYFSVNPDSTGVWFHALRNLAIVALISSALGLLTRVSLLVAWLAFSIYEYQVAHLLHPYTTNLTFFALLALVLAEHVGEGGWDSWWRRHKDKTIPFCLPRVSGWPLKFIQLMLALAYLSAAFTKIRVSGESWLDGTSMQGHLLENYLFTNSTYAKELMNSVAICRVISLGTLAFEGLFWLILVFPSARWFFLIGGLVFHFAVLQIMEINFFYFFFPAYLAFLR